MITINEFKLSDDLASITLKLQSSDNVELIYIYVGENYLTDTYYSVPVTPGLLEYDVTIPAVTLGVNAPMTDIFIVHAENRFSEVAEAGIWSLEAPSHCLAEKVLAYPDSCRDCKGIIDVNIIHMNIEATVIYLAQKDFVKALKTKSKVEQSCEDYGNFSIPPGGACPGGIGCWIIEDDFIVQ